MKTYERPAGQGWTLALLLSVLAAGCGRDPVLGAGGANLAPSVTAVTPAPGAVGVPVTGRAATATFSEPMNSASITTASFTLDCPGGTPVAGTVTYADATRTATFTATADLPATTLCRATVSTAARDVDGAGLANPFTWSFTTGPAPDTTPPTVSATVPAADATGVPLNRTLSASFSEPMRSTTITTASFGLACPAGTPMAGVVGYTPGGNVATFNPDASLPAATVCTATITTAVTDVAGNAMEDDFTWSFRTGAGPDTTAPTVTSTDPVDGAAAVARNAQVSATFSEPMDPATLTPASFTLACPAGAPVAGTVAYAVNGDTATFTPATSLPAGTLCAATITTGATDTAGNALAADFTWSFTTGAAADTTAPTVDAVSPADLATGVCLNKTLNATFSEAMDPHTITTATLRLRETGGPLVQGVVGYDTATRIASFDPSILLTVATHYTATIRGGAAGVKDVGGNAMTLDFVTTFTTGPAPCASAPPLGAAAPFGAFGGNATLTNDGLDTVIHGDVGVNAASTTVTGLRDSGGNVYTVTPNNDGTVNGLVYTLTAPPGSVAGEAVTQARADAQAAFDSISPANLPGGIDVSSLAQCPSCGGAGGGPDELAGRILPPGVYLSTTGTYDIGGPGRTTADLTLDGGGDTSAVWVFQTAAGTGTLNVGLTGPATPAVPIRVRLINGARSKNVFWYVPAGATIGTGATVAGTLLADASITLSTTGGSPPTAVITTLNGRAIALTAGVTVTNTVINLPAP